MLDEFTEFRLDAVESLRQPLRPGWLPLADALADQALSQVIRIDSGKSIISGHGGIEVWPHQPPS